MKRLPRLKLDWEGKWVPRATGPDGTEYLINSEARHPGRAFFPEVKRPYMDRFYEPGQFYGPNDRFDDFPVHEEVFGASGVLPTKAAAIRWCEIDAYRRQEKKP